MTYTDGNSDRICQWEDLQPEEMPAAARAMMDAGKYITKIGGLWHKLEEQDRLGLKVWLIARSKAEKEQELTITNHNLSEPQKVDKSGHIPRLTKLEKRRLKREAWLEFWTPKLQFIRMYVHQRDKYGWTRPRTCSEIAAWTGLPPYKVSRIAQKALQLGLIAKQGRCYVPKVGRPPVLLHQLQRKVERKGHEVSAFSAKYDESLSIGPAVLAVAWPPAL